MSRFYNERQHLKGPVDGLGGTEKNVISRDSKSESAKSTHRKSLKYSNKRVKSITTLYLPECKLFVEPNEVKKAPKIPQTLPVHKVIRNMSKNVIVGLQFSIWPMIKNNTIPRKVIQKSVATKE